MAVVATPSDPSLSWRSRTVPERSGRCIHILRPTRGREEETKGREEESTRGDETRERDENGRRARCFSLFDLNTAERWNGCP